VLERIHGFGKRNYRLHMAVAPTKNIDRYEWFLEKATEIGIDEITPLICEHSERKEVKIERLNKVLVSAMKQSIKAYLPKLNPGISFRNFVSAQSGWKQEAGRGKHDLPTPLPSSIFQKLICSCDADKDALLKNLYHANSDVLF